MAIFLKEAVFLMILVTVLCLPRRPFDAQLAPESIKGFLNDENEKEEVYPIRPITGAESADTSVERPARADVEEEEKEEEEEEVYPMRPINVSKADEEEKDDFVFLKSRKAFRTRRGVASNNKKWPKQGDKVNINYVFDGVNDETQTWLKDIFRELDLKTCIHFQHGAIGHYVKFTKGTGQCKSDIGYRETKPLQEVHLWNPGCDFRGTIIHEVLHLLGFYHEHQRYDRDNFIIIHKDNIETGLSKQFDTIGSQNLLPPYNGYDEHSIMQYNEFAFSKEYGVKKTMEARDGKRLGQDSHMDANDIMKINHFYGCPALKFKDTKLTLKTADSFLAGTNGDVYVKLKGSQGESDFEQVTEGGMIADENERGARETHNMAFRDVGKVNGIVVALVKKGALPSEKKKRSFESEEEKRKRWFSSDGWTVETIQLQTSDGTSATFPGGDLYEGDTKELSPS